MRAGPARSGRGAGPRGGRWRRHAGSSRNGPGRSRRCAPPAGRFPDRDERAMGYAVRTHLPLVVVPDDSAVGVPPRPGFAVAESWLGQSPAGRGAALDALVLRYLAAFGPAAAADVQAWSGLTGVRPVLEALRPRLRVFRDDRKRRAVRPAGGAPAAGGHARSRALPPGFRQPDPLPRRPHADHRRRAPAARHHPEPPGPAHVPGRRLRRRHLDLHPATGTPPA